MRWCEMLNKGWMPSSTCIPPHRCQDDGVFQAGSCSQPGPSACKCVGCGLNSPNPPPGNCRNCGGDQFADVEPPQPQGPAEVADNPFYAKSSKW